MRLERMLINHYVTSGSYFSSLFSASAFARGQNNGPSEQTCLHNHKSCRAQGGQIESNSFNQNQESSRKSQRMERRLERQVT